MSLFLDIVKNLWYWYICRSRVCEGVSYILRCGFTIVWPILVFISVINHGVNYSMFLTLLWSGVIVCAHFVMWFVGLLIMELVVVLAVKVYGRVEFVDICMITRRFLKQSVKSLPTILVGYRTPNMIVTSLHHKQCDLVPWESWLPHLSRSLE